MSLLSNTVHELVDLRLIKQQQLGYNKSILFHSTQTRELSTLAYNGLKVRSAVRVSQGDLVLELGHLLDIFYKTDVRENKTKEKRISQSVILLPISRRSNGLITHTLKRNVCLQGRGVRRADTDDSVDARWVVKGKAPDNSSAPT